MGQSVTFPVHVTDTITGFVQGIWLGFEMNEQPSDPIIRMEDAKMKYFAA